MTADDLDGGWDSPASGTPKPAPVVPVATVAGATIEATVETAPIDDGWGIDAGTEDVASPPTEVAAAPREASAPLASPPSRPRRHHDMRAPRTTRSTKESPYFDRRSGSAHPPPGPQGRSADPRPARAEGMPQRPRRNLPRDERPRDARPRREERRDEPPKAEVRTRPRTDKPVAPAPVPVIEAPPAPVGDVAREELLLLAAPRVTTSQPKVEKREKPRTAKEALQLRARQKAQGKPAKQGQRDRRAERDAGAVVPTAADDRDDEVAVSTPRPASSKPGPSKKGQAGARRRAAPPEPQLEAVPPPPKPGLWTRIKGFFGG